MSAMDQKPTFWGLGRMSALPPKADIATAVQNVRLVPIAEIWPGLRILFSKLFSRTALSQNRGQGREATYSRFPVVMDEDILPSE